MAVLAGGYGSWQDHVGEDNRRKIRALDDRIAHLEARIEQLEAKLGDEADELVGEHGGDDESNAISADEMRRTVLLWAERFQPGDCWDTEDQRDLEAALTGTVEANPTCHQLRVLAGHDETGQ
jgi:hypothetical protein